MSTALVRHAVAYLRVSTDDQRLGVDAQAATIAAYCYSHQIVLTTSYLDRAISGATPIQDRPALSALIHDVAQSRIRRRVQHAPIYVDSTRVHSAANPVQHAPIDTVIVARRDRVARDVYLSLAIDRALPRGVSILDATGSANGTSPGDDMHRTMLAAMSQYERALIRERTRAALEALRARGKRAGNVPLGYTADVDGTLVPCPVEQGTIALVARLLLTAPSRRSIVVLLAAMGVVSPRSGRPYGWTQVRVLVDLALSPREPKAA